MASVRNEWGERQRSPLPATFTDLKNRAVLVTGGATGIGAAMTEGFAGQGARVAFLDVAEAEARALCDRIEYPQGRRPLFRPCDVTDTPALQRTIAAFAKDLGGIDVLVNVAANDRRHRTEEVTEDFWAWSMNINLKAYFFAAQSVIAPMRAAGGGAIINFSSVAYMMGMAGMPCYTSANAAIVSLTHSLAREFGADGIRVNAIAPGMVLTPRQKELWLTPEAVADHVKNQCLPEPMQPGDLVGAALFLASGTSRMMTGQVMIVDGGLISPS